MGVIDRDEESCQIKHEQGSSGLIFACLAPDYCSVG